MRNELLWLPHGEVWIGFDDAGISVSASLERNKPTTRLGSVMHGCAAVLKCKVSTPLFRRHVSEFEQVAE